MAERPEDLNLPNSVITRIIKEALPDGVNISMDARSAVARAASVFVLYATSCANHYALKGKRKTLNAGDVLAAVEEMHFKRFVVPLKNSLEVHRPGQKGKKQTMEPKRKEVSKKNGLEDQDKSRDEDEKIEDENPHKVNEKEAEN